VADLKWRIVVRDHGKAALLVECERGTHHGNAALECHRSLWRNPPSAPNGVATMWQWDGNVEQPTITPSIDCQGGCGRHFTMTQGVPR
jgi:hypothetical protein